MKYELENTFAHYLGRVFRKLRLSSIAKALLFFFNNPESEKVQERLKLAQKIENSPWIDQILTASSNTDSAWQTFEHQQDLLKTINIIENIPLFKEHWPGLYFSQEGEDVLIEKLLNNKPHGSYLEIGAHHPLRFSNTAHFYLKGWRGIVVDPDTRNQELFDKCRPEDIFIPRAIGIKKETKMFYVMKEGALNSFDKTYIDWLITEKGYLLQETRELEVLPLFDLIKQYPQIQNVDFLSLDVEGHELEVLTSNDWSVFKPQIIATEILNSNLDTIHLSPVHQLLSAKGYFATSKLANSVIYTLQT